MTNRKFSSIQNLSYLSINTIGSHYPKKLFKGQTNHPLSEEEKKLFFDKLSLSGRWFAFGDEKKLKDSLLASMNLPTAREQIRQIISSPIKEFNIAVSRTKDKFIKKNEFQGVYIFEEKTTYIRSDFLHNEKPLVVGNIIFHELLHARQRKITPDIPKIYLDAETQSLTLQLLKETDDKSYTGYNQSYEENLKKWQKIANGKMKRPSWAIPLEYEEGLTKEEKALAKEQYAMQMAALETRSQFISEWISSEQDLKSGKKKMPVFDYNALTFSRVYDEQDTAVNSSIERDWDLAIQDLQDLKKEYPALDVKEITASLNELKQEYNENKSEHSIHQLNQEIHLSKSLRSQAFIHQDDFTETYSQTLLELLEKNPVYQLIGIPEPLLVETLFNQKGSISQKMEQIKQVIVIINDKGNDDSTKEVMLCCANTLLQNKELNRAEKLKYTTQILAFSQQLYPQDKETRRKIVSQLNKAIGTQIPLAQQEPLPDRNSGLLDTLRNNQQTPYNEEIDLILPHKNSRENIC